MIINGFHLVFIYFVCFLSENGLCKFGNRKIPENWSILILGKLPAFLYFNLDFFLTENDFQNSKLVEILEIGKFQKIGVSSYWGNYLLFYILIWFAFAQKMIFKNSKIEKILEIEEKLIVK